MVKKKNIIRLLKNVKLLVLDVDGVLTKGEIIYDDTGRLLKVFDVKDGLGVYLLGKVGVPVILFSAKKSSVLEKRAKDMGIKQVIAGILPKEKALKSIMSRYGISEKEICFMGDDLIDISLMSKVGVGVAVKDAVLAVRDCACYVTKAKGGCGAVREIIDMIIKAQNLEKKIYQFVQNQC